VRIQRLWVAWKTSWVLLEAKPSCLKEILWARRSLEQLASSHWNYSRFLCFLSFVVFYIDDIASINVLLLFYFHTPSIINKKINVVPSIIGVLGLYLMCLMEILCGKS